MKPTTALVVCTSPRTGSGVLCSALWSSGRCGQPDEYLAENTRREYEAEWGCQDDREYLEQMLERTTTPNGVFSVKVHWEHTANVQWLDGILGGGGTSATDTLRALAPRVHFVWLSRRDRVRQAVSMYRAAHSGRYRSYDEPARTVDDVPFDAVAIERLRQQCDEFEGRWAADFEAAGIGPLHVWYEDGLEHDYVAATRAVLEWMGLEVPHDLALTSDYEKQADEESERLVERFTQREPTRET
jgi:LPS sulfotransferase NodH